MVTGLERKFWKKNKGKILKRITMNTSRVEGVTGGERGTSVILSTRKITFKKK